MSKKRRWLSLAMASGVSFGCNGPISETEAVDQLREALNICNETVPTTRAVDGIPAYAQCTAAQNSAIYSNNGIDTSTLNEGTGWVRTQSSGGYQCTELAGRYLVFHWGVTWRPTGNAGTWCDTAPPSTSGVVQTTVPVHGDIIVFPPGSCGASTTTGHVAVVDTVNTATSQVTFVEQNSPSRRTGAFSCAACFLHVVANTGEGGSGGASAAGGAASSAGGSAPGTGGTKATGGASTSTGGAAASVGGSRASGGTTSAAGGNLTTGGSASVTGGTAATIGGTGVITGGTTSGLVAPVTGGSAAARGGAAPGAGGTSGAGGSSTTGGGPASSNSGQGGSAVTGTSGSSALAGGQARNDLPEIANDDSGCSCTIPNQGGARGGASELVGLLGMVLLGWRKRRRPASTRP